MPTHNSHFSVDEAAIARLLKRAESPPPSRVREILARALELKGLPDDEVVALMSVDDPALSQEIHHAARRVKDLIYGDRMVLFAPLYASNMCGNDCLYCAFRVSNKFVRRRVLTQDEIAEEVRRLLHQGHKRVLLVAGEAYPGQGLDYIFDSIATIYATREGAGEIRRVNANIAPLAVEEFRRLKDAGIGTYQLFQETYHRETYTRVHPRGPKANFEWRLSAMDRAMEAGVDDVGIGVLFGLADWRFEILALLQHKRRLEARFGVGPHTISVPRLEPAEGAPLASRPPHPVDDAAFRKVIAILRLAVPYTGLILSTRETPEMRREAFQLGISQISAGSRTNPGGYGDDHPGGEQFSLGDHRPLDAVVRDLADLGFVPSFCTACYRLGRTGRDFMDLARPGEIKDHCQPNALATFVEHLLDYASPDTRDIGEALVERTLAGMDEPHAARARALIDRVRAGARDVFC